MTLDNGPYHPNIYILKTNYQNNSNMVLIYLGFHIFSNKISKTYQMLESIYNSMFHMQINFNKKLHS